jgi:predicted dehydrogenase/threonine dehydrogenase-like Zn-dependent dehydrogenase
MKQVLLRRGHAVVEDVPAPLAERGTVLVRVDRSCISTGTELSSLRATGTPIWQRAARQPEHVRRVVGVAATQGVRSARNLVASKLDAGMPTGYSAAGTVLAVGAGVDDLAPGDRVACGGSQWAHHAEVIRVPRNLVVRIPDGVTSDAASTVTLGAIALQGVRRAQPTLGETFVVVGLGIVGQLTAQLLRANGCRVIGADPDPRRLQLALELGMDASIDGDADGPTSVLRLTDGVGADGVIVTASTSSNTVIASAFQMCRRKGRVVLVGDVGLDLDRRDIYEKELDFLISTSYGPGRYDATYEENGLDYPIGYVRWTENRNMAEYLRLVAQRRVQVEPLIGGTFPVERAAAAYEALDAPSDRPLIVLLEYPATSEGSERRAVSNPTARSARSGALRLAVVGAGQFATGTHLPNMAGLEGELHLHAVVSRSPHKAGAIARQYGAAYATTDFARVLEDPEVDACLIATRHDLHATMALDALRHGKHVLVEKPLAISAVELQAVEDFFATSDGDKPILMTGFNRRFSAYAEQLAALVAGRTSPVLLNYRFNAGYLPPDHWVHGPEGGSRNLGEACHVYDLLTFLTDSEVKEVTAAAVRPATAHYRADDNFVATIAFKDGSIATLTYTAMGSPEHPKEQLDLFVDGKVITLDDFQRLSIAGTQRKLLLKTNTPQKGQAEELRAFAAGVRAGRWPIPLWQQLQATDIALQVEAQTVPDRS